MRAHHGEGNRQGMSGKYVFPKMIEPFAGEDAQDQHQGNNKFGNAAEIIELEEILIEPDIDRGVRSPALRLSARQ